MPEALTRTLSRIDKSMFEYLVTNPQAVRLKPIVTKAKVLFRISDQLRAHKITCMIVYFNLPFLATFHFTTERIHLNCIPLTR